MKGETKEHLLQELEQLRQRVAEVERSGKKLLRLNKKLERDLRSLSSKAWFNEERQRRRFAEYLHGDMIQSLIFVKQKVEVLKRSNLKGDRGRRVQEIDRTLDEIITNARDLTFEMNPPILHEFGLDAALESLCSRMEERHAIPITLRIDYQPKLFSEEASVVLFQGVRELLANVVRHAHASKVQVSLRKLRNFVQIVVEDDGVGFNTRAVQRTGFGLSHLRHSLHTQGGTLRIKSRPSKGTRATLLFPATAPR